jgi:hypothetical protein
VSRKLVDSIVESSTGRVMVDVACMGASEVERRLTYAMPQAQDVYRGLTMIDVV